MADEPLEDGPFFHGTVAPLGVNDTFTAGRASNYRPEVVMKHVYFTASLDIAGLAAELAAELAADDPVPRVFRVEPTGPFENDPNVTDKKFSRKSHEVLPQQRAASHRRRDHGLDAPYT